MIQVHVKNVNSGTNNHSVIDKYSYEIILRYPIEGKLTNVNVMLTKLGYAECSNLAIFNGEKEILKESEATFCQKIHQATKLESNVQVHISHYGQREKILYNAPTNSVLCKVTNAVSPSEIWVQDITHAENYYEAFQMLIYDRYKQLTHFDAALKEWSKEDYCVVKCASNVFCRAKIIAKLTNGKYKLLCLDDGSYVENAVETNMFELIDEFKKPEFIAKKCRLLGILPMGTNNGREF